MGHAGKWEKFLAELPEGAQGTTQSLLKLQQDFLQNTAAWMSQPTKSAQAGPFNKFVFPIVRKSYPQLISQNIVSVQPMTSPVGGIFFYGMEYGGARNPMAVGDSVQSTRKINKQIIYGTVIDIVERRRKSGPKRFAVVENAKTGKKHRIDPKDLKKISPLDVLAAVT